MPSLPHSTRPHDDTKPVRHLHAQETWRCVRAAPLLSRAQRAGVGPVAIARKQAGRSDYRNSQLTKGEDDLALSSGYLMIHLLRGVIWAKLLRRAALPLDLPQLCQRGGAFPFAHIFCYLDPLGTKAHQIPGLVTHESKPLCVERAKQSIADCLG